MNDRNNPRRARFTLAELLIVVALVAIVAGIVVKVRQEAESAELSISVLQFSLDGRRLVAAFNNGSVRAWDCADLMQVASLPPPPGFSLQTGVSSDGRTIARAYLADADKRLQAMEIRDLLTGKEIRTLSLPEDDELHGIIFSPDGKWMALGEHDQDRIRLIPVDGSQLEEIVLAPLVRYGSGQLFSILPEFSSDGRRLWYVADDKFVRWNLESQQVERKRLEYDSGSYLLANSIAVSPDEKTIVLAGWQFDGATKNSTTVLWKLSGEGLDRQGGSHPHGGSVCAIAYLDAGKSLAALNDLSLDILDPESFELRTQVPLEEHCNQLVASADGKLLAISNFESLYLFDGAQVRKVADCRPSSIGKYLLIAAFVLVLVQWIAMRVLRIQRIGHKAHLPA